MHVHRDRKLQGANFWLLERVKASKAMQRAVLDKSSGSKDTFNIAEKFCFALRFIEILIYINYGRRDKR